jgi:hypothetical protein
VLAESEAKIERAKEQIKYLESSVKEFLRTEMYSFDVDEDSESREWVHRLRIHKEMPLRFSIIVGEIVHDLRSALDNLICHLARKAGATDCSETGFPISNCDRVDAERAANQYKSLVGSKVKSAGTQIVSIVENIKAYPGGNEGLWKLHKVNIGDKHRLPVLVGNRYTAYGFDMIEHVFGVGADLPPMQCSVTEVRTLPLPIEDGAELHRVRMAPWPEPAKQFSFTFEVSFIEPEVVKGEALIPTLNQFVGLTKNVLELFDRHL